MADKSANSIIRVKQADGTYKTFLPQNSSQNVTDDGRTMTDIISEDLASKDHEHKYSSDIPSTADLGGIDKGFNTTDDGVSLDEMIFKLLHPYVKPTISYICSPNGGVYEIGSTIANVSVNAIANKESDTIQKVNIYKNDEVVSSETWNKDGNCAISFADTNISSDTVFKADVNDGKNTVISDKTVFKFVRPVYVGIIPADISGGVTSNMIIGMSKKIMIQDEITNSFTLTSGRMCIATPPGWEITKITDPNNLDITNSFEKHIVSITCLDGQSVGYNVYVSNVTAQTNFVVNFK